MKRIHHTSTVTKLVTQGHSNADHSNKKVKQHDILNNEQVKKTINNDIDDDMIVDINDHNSIIFSDNDDSTEFENLSTNRILDESLNLDQERIESIDQSLDNKLLGEALDLQDKSLHDGSLHDGSLHDGSLQEGSLEDQSSSCTTKPLNFLDFYDLMEELKRDSEEAILDESNSRLAILPNDPKYMILWELHKKQREAIWFPDEIDFSNDRHDFMDLINQSETPEKQQHGKNVQHFIKMILAFFAGADSIVNINIKKKLSKITIKEAEVGYAFQQMMENIHGEVYANMLIDIIEDPVERDELINAFKNVESIERMINWGKKWIESERRIGFSLVAFVIFEGLMFSGAFAAIYWLKKIVGESRMKGLMQSNNLIAKDEGMHTNFGCAMYNFVKNRLTKEEFDCLMMEAVEISKNFVNDAIRVDMIGMNVELMSTYVEYTADRLCVLMGYDKIYNSNLPDAFQFMDAIGFSNKDNFFERRPTEYQKSYNSKNKADWKFKILDEY
jgi:ribonucleotide reductase beta subunit family protein with ferritin-like domain